MKARTTSRKGNPILAATGVRAVAIDHQTTANPKTLFPPTVSAHTPPAIYRSRQKINTNACNPVSELCSVTEHAHVFW